MSFGGVDEKKLVAEAKEQLLPEVEEMRQRSINEFLSGLRQLMDENDLTITVTKKQPRS